MRPAVPQSRRASQLSTTRLHEQSFTVADLEAAQARSACSPVESARSALEHLRLSGPPWSRRRARRTSGMSACFALASRGLQPDDIYVLYKYGDFLRRLAQPRAEDSDRSARARSSRRVWDPRCRHTPRTALPYAAEIAALCAALSAHIAARRKRSRPTAIVAAARSADVRCRHPTCTTWRRTLDLTGRTQLDEAMASTIAACSRLPPTRSWSCPIQEGITGHVSVITGMAQVRLPAEGRRSKRALRRCSSQSLEPCAPDRTTSTALARCRKLYLQERRPTP